MTDMDKKVLRNIYLLRCLDTDLMYEFFYKTEGNSLDYTKRRIRRFVKAEIIEKEKYGPWKYGLFLTTKGINFIRKYIELPKENYLIEDKKTITGMYAAHQLKIDPFLINHQLHLNHFVLSLKKYIKNKEISHTYWDERYLSKYVVLRPDGLMKTHEYDFLLEMDMGTESSYQLKKKWNNYRRFKYSDIYYQREQDIKTFFIIGGNKNIELKKRRVRKSILKEISETVEKDFDFFIGSSDELLHVIKDMFLENSYHIEERVPKIKGILSSECGYTISAGSKIMHLTDNIEFDFYARKLTQDKNIKYTNEFPHEYVVDLYHGEPLSVLKKISYMQRISSFFRNQTKRNLKYIVVIEDDRKMYENLKEIGILEVNNVYFTTVNRLKELLFWEALFQYSTSGNVFHFENETLQKRVFEKTI
jgi:hypothetical protein